MAFAGGAQAAVGNFQANAAHKWKQKMEEAGEHNAFLSNAVQQRQLGTQTQQKMRSVNEEIRMIQRKGNQVAAAAAVRATKGGVQADSASVQALQQFGKDAMQAIGVRDVEGQETLTFSQQQAKAIELQTQARIDSVQAGPAPSFGGQVLNVISGVAQGYMSGKDMQNPITPAAPTGGAFAPMGSASTYGLSIVPANPISSGLGGTALTTANPYLSIGSMPHSALWNMPITKLPAQGSMNLFNPYPVGPLSSFGPFSPFASFGTY
jgi:hypothetical protein